MSFTDCVLCRATRSSSSRITRVPSASTRRASSVPQSLDQSSVWASATGKPSVQRIQGSATFFAVRIRNYFSIRIRNFFSVRMRIAQPILQFGSATYFCSQDPQYFSIRIHKNIFKLGSANIFKLGSVTRYPFKLGSKTVIQSGSATVFQFRSATVFQL